MKKIFGWFYKAFLAGGSAFTALRYWLLNLHGLDLVTTVLVFLIALAGFGKIYIGWKFPIIDNFPRFKKFIGFLPKTKPEKMIRMAENEDFTAFKNLKGGLNKFMKLFETIKKVWVFYVRINPKASAGNVGIIGLYIGLMYDLVNKYHVYKLDWRTFTHQPEQVYWLSSAYTLGMILGLIASHSKVFKTWEEKVFHNNKNAIMDVYGQLLILDVKNNLEIAKTLCDEGTHLLDVVKDFIPTDLYNKIKTVIDTVTTQRRKVVAQQLLEAENERKALLAEAQKDLGQLPQSGSNINVR